MRLTSSTPATYAISGVKGTFKENAASGKLEFTDALRCEGIQKDVSA